MKNFIPPAKRHPNHRRGRFSSNTTMPTGVLTRWWAMIEMPVTPPETTLLGTKKRFVPAATISEPTTIWT
jgi:hypothetical protein